jgi:hypothetical protein
MASATWLAVRIPGARGSRNRSPAALAEWVFLRARQEQPETLGLEGDMLQAQQREIGGAVGAREPHEQERPVAAIAKAVSTSSEKAFDVFDAQRIGPALARAELPADAALEEANACGRIRSSVPGGGMGKANRDAGAADGAHLAAAAGDDRVARRSERGVKPRSRCRCCSSRRTADCATWFNTFVPEQHK